MKLGSENRLEFLVSDIARRLRERFNDSAQSLGLTLAQARTLLQLARNQGISQVALARLLEIQPITLLRQIDRLEETGLVKRRPNPADRRAQQLYLTAAAEPLLDNISDIGNALTDRAFSGFDEDGRALAVSLLQQIRGNLSD